MSIAALNQKASRKSIGRSRRRKPTARCDWHRSKPLRLEGLEDRALLTAGVREEYLLELINQMRTEPVDELPLLLNSTDPNVQSALSFFNVNTTLLSQQWATLTAAPPVTYNDILASTALSHSELMSQDDQQSHQLPGEADLLTRIQAAGYSVSIVGENIYAYAKEMFQAHAAFAIDWGNGTGGMETPPGHRQNIMNAAFREVGLGVVDGGGAGKTTGPVLVTEDFGAQQNPGNPYLVGAVFTGTAYSLSGEGTPQVSSNGLANITVTAVSTANSAVSFSATTTAAGGYQLQLPAGSYTVTFSGSGLAANVVKSVTVGTDNVLLNVTAPAAVLPSSSVAALPATETSANFTVNWSGSDTGGPGIATYSVFVSDNGGAFTPFLTATTQTSATFNGVNGHTYGFYSVATDTFGNVQTTPSAAQASTTVTVAVSPITAEEHTYVIGSGTITVSALDGLLTGDTGPSQLAVTAGTIAGASGGTFTINADGSFTYMPAASFPGYDNAQFTVTDASGDKTTAIVNVLSPHAGVVWKFYESVLNREPDTGGLQYWTNYFNNGGSTGDMAFGFFESDELLNKVLGNYYQQYLLRPLDSGGLAYWKGVWHATGGPEQIKAGFADSPEFYASSGGTPDSWIDALYQRILSRTPDPSGKSFWLNYYQQQTAAGTDAGTVRYNIALGFFDSQESYGQDVAGWFQEYLFRAPTDAEKTQYVSQMESGASDRTIEQEITNMPEYGINPSRPPDGIADALPSYYPSAQTHAALAVRDQVFAGL